MRWISGPIQRLRQASNNNPRLANTVIFGSTGTFGAELFQQTINNKVLPGKGRRKPYDWGSLARFWVAGYLIFPHVFWHWYRLLDRLFPGAAVKNVVRKTITDQLIAPAPIIILFYTTMSMMEGKPDVFAECKAKLETTLKARYCFMLPAAAINFSIVPSAYRVAFQGITTFFWVNLLCYLKRLNLDDSAFTQPSLQ